MGGSRGCVGVELGWCIWRRCQCGYMIGGSFRGSGRACERVTVLLHRELDCLEHLEFGCSVELWCVTGDGKNWQKLAGVFICQFANSNIADQVLSRLITRIYLLAIPSPLAGSTFNIRINSPASRRAMRANIYTSSTSIVICQPLRFRESPRMARSSYSSSLDSTLACCRIAR